MKIINSKNWLQNELLHKIPKKGILSLTKVKLTVGGDGMASSKSVVVFLYTLLFCLL